MKEQVNTTTLSSLYGLGTGYEQPLIRVIRLHSNTAMMQTLSKGGENLNKISGNDYWEDE